MDNLEIIVDEPNIEITDEYSVDYDLPIASQTTLGGVKIGSNISVTSDGTISNPIASADIAGVIKVGSNLSIDENGVLSGQAGGSVTVDSTLSTVSTNPVQNRVITSEINSTNATVTNISGSITSINSNIANINDAIVTTNGNVTTNANNISALQTAVGTNTDNISTNTGNISTLNTTVGGIDDRLTSAEGTITDQGNALSTLQGVVDPLTTTFSETAAGTTIDNTIWTGGDVTIIRRGKVGEVKLNLEGSYTLAGASSKLVYTMSDQDNLPAFVANGCLYTDEGAVYAEFDVEGKLIIYNYGNQNIALSYLMGSIPVIFI